MLFTRCPDCDTTFRVTDEALKKANGHVRCGRCASVFNAYTERQSPRPATAATEPTSASGDVPSPSTDAPPTEPAKNADTEQLTPPIQTEPRAAAAVDALRDTVADDAIVGEVATLPPSPTGPVDVGAVDDVLANATPARSVAPPVVRAMNSRARSSRWWSIAAVMAFFAIAAQVANHYRAELAGDPRIGAWVQSAYEQIGIEVTPRWDVRQYEILDWVATAEPNSAGIGSLKITARIRNRGPLHHPFPAVQLRLKDRWEEAVGARMFTPGEYLPRDVALGRLMAPGETTRAELELVDPGPDAYGFELDVCVQVQPGQLTCGNDEVFL